MNYPRSVGQKWQVCGRKGEVFLSLLSDAAAKDFQCIKRSSAYPADSMLFLENEPARGIYLLCSGAVKLSVSSRNGRTLILRVASAGDILGLTASMSASLHEAKAETLYPCRIDFIRRDDFIRFIDKYPEVYPAVLQMMSTEYNLACEQLRTIGLSSSAHQKLVRLLLQWSSDGKETPDGKQFEVPLTHEQIAECVGTTRETVTRTLTELKKKRLIVSRGATMIISSVAAMRGIEAA